MTIPRPAPPSTSLGAPDIFLAQNLIQKPVPTFWDHELCWRMIVSEIRMS